MSRKSVASSGAYDCCRLSVIFYNEPEQRKKLRKEQVSPLVDAFFLWVRSNIGSVGTGNTLYKAMQYSLNQESYLRVFLNDPFVPLDNNNAEVAIRSFCVGRNN